MVYVTKSISQVAGLGGHATDTQREHVHRLYAELQITPCSPQCPVWLPRSAQLIDELLGP